MTYSAIVSLRQSSKLNSAMDTLTNDILDSVKEIISAVHPTCCPKFRQIVHDVVDEFQQVVGHVVQKGQEISVAIQRDVVTSLMKVTTSSAPRSSEPTRNTRFSQKYATGIDISQNVRPTRGETIMGTFRFGLSTSNERGSKALILPQVFTRSQIPLKRYT